jgi:hypothetical protein
MRKRPCLLVLLLLASASFGAVGGCGNHAGGSDPKVPSDIQAIFAKPLYQHAVWGLRVIDQATGEYIFVDCSKGISLSGTGTLSEFFCKMTLTDRGTDPKRPDRNINILVNPCTGVGTATISFGCRHERL